MDNGFLNFLLVGVLGPAVAALIISGIGKLIIKDMKFSTIYFYTFCAIFVFNLIRDLFFPSLIKY